jgi:hypothetical protein
MKKIKFLLVLSLVLISSANAGFFGSMIGGGIGGSIGSSGNGGSQNLTVSRISKINTYLWNMHTNNSYTSDYKFYLKFLLESDDIAELDTAAQVLKDNGQKKEAIKLYEIRIMPWVKLEDQATQDKYNNYFQEIKK